MGETDGLKSKAITASVWAVIEKFSLMAAQFIIGIILARLLEPSDFGLIALTTIFITISNAITDGGFETALIQQKELTEIQINTAFYLNMLLGIVMGIVLYFSAPFIADYFHQPELNLILKWLCVIMPLEALGQTQRTLLIRELHFKKISIYQIISSVLSGIVGIMLAYYGYGVLALVYSTILALIIRSSLLWISSGWYPQFLFSYTSIASLIPIGLNVLVSSIIMFFIQQFSVLVIGKHYNEKALGLYNRGMKFPELVISIIQSVVLKLSLPMFAKLQDQNEKLEAVLMKTNSIVAFISFPLMLFLFIDAKEIVILLLTAKWIGAVIYLKIFCVVKIFEPFISVQRDFLLSKGKSKLSLYLSVFTSIIEVVTIIISAKYSITSIILTVMLNKIVQYLLYLIIDIKNRFVIIYNQLKVIVSYIIICLLIMVVMRLIDQGSYRFVNDNLIAKLFMDVFVGTGLYLLFCFILRNKDIFLVKGILTSVKTTKINVSKI